MTRRDDLRVDKALQGADFPTDRATLLAYAQERGAEDKTLEAIRGLPEGSYANAAEVVDAVPQEPEGDRPGGTER